MSITDNPDGNFEPRFSDFHTLMPFRIREILLISSYYDAFVLQEDGQLTEQLFNTFLNLNLRYAPRIIRTDSSKALQMLSERNFELVIIMPQLHEISPFELCETIKEQYEAIPVVYLTYQTSTIMEDRERALKAGFENLFIWSGNSRIFLAIIKYVEDKLNAPSDTAAGDVRVVILVEDTPSYYSSMLPLVYELLVTQTQKLMSEGLNDMHRLLRMRARPKLLLAHDYEGAISLINKYEKNILGIISDVNYQSEGKRDPAAGFKLLEHIKSKDSSMPILLLSEEEENRERAQKLGAQFVDKNSDSVIEQFKFFIKTQFGFGDFIFRLEDKTPVGIATDLRSLQKNLKDVPVESIIYHSFHDDFSTWIMARSEFSLARLIKSKNIEDFENPEEIRNFLINTIREFRRERRKGLITDFNRSNFDEENQFTRFRGGSIGGKARGITFISSLLEKSSFQNKYPGVKIAVPSSLIIGTDEFEDFMDRNQLHYLYHSIKSDEELVRIFAHCSHSEGLKENLGTFLESVHCPLAVRSSSLLEDSHYQPFAGIYKTLMIPNSSEDINVRLGQLETAISMVFSSIFTNTARAYLKSTNHRIEEEMMAVIIQEVAGKKYDRYFYPNVSGVAQSWNFFPFSHMEPDEGVANIALGLGRIIVDEGTSLMFSPAHPEILPQFPTIQDALNNSQKHFYACDLDAYFDPMRGESAGLKKLPLGKALDHGSITRLVSTYVGADNIIVDSFYYQGPKILTFAQLLKYNHLPFSEIISDILKTGSRAMGTSVEIEFALNISEDENEPHDFYLLQIRPMVAGGEFVELKIDPEKDKMQLAGFSEKSLGNGKIEGIRDVVFVDPDTFNAANTTQIAREVGVLNEKLKNTRYLLIGLGRWGSSDPWLGIGVNWEDICNAAAIVEAGTADFNIELSMGTHFFHNLISMGVPYMTMPWKQGNGFIDWEYLRDQKEVERTEFLRWINIPDGLEIKIDGRKSFGAIYKPYEKSDSGLKNKK
ncbi:MAG: hypothetical protein JXR95_15320 [Deltaproteobacteria bacterium]|nr:hypothetical protein [Deltaproteobacteria bacterium]